MAVCRHVRWITKNRISNQNSHTFWIQFKKFNAHNQLNRSRRKKQWTLHVRQFLAQRIKVINRELPLCDQRTIKELVQKQHFFGKIKRLTCVCHHFWAIFFLTLCITVWYLSPLGRFFPNFTVIVRSSDS